MLSARQIVDLSGISDSNADTPRIALSARRLRSGLDQATPRLEVVEPPFAKILDVIEPGEVADAKIVTSRRYGLGRFAGLRGLSRANNLHGMIEVELRGWHPDDAPALLDAFSSPDMAQQAARPVDTPAAALEWMGLWGFRDDAKAFAVVVDGRVVGNVAVSNIDTHDTGWVSYWTSPHARGRGVAAAAAGKLAEWAFKERGLFRLELGHRLDNPASCAVATRAGFLVEGIERAKLNYEGVRYDVERHARLATD